MNPQSGVVSVDVGGTNVRAARWSDGTDWSDTWSEPRSRYESPVEWLERLLARHPDWKRDRWVVGVPSPVRDGSEVAETPNLPEEWSHQSIPQALRERGLSFVLENDANLAALGEASFGAGQSVRDLICLTLGTGIGTGIVIDGQIHRGATGAAAEGGHLVLEPAGRVCGCGNTGCFETYASARGLERTYRDLGGEPTGAREIMNRVDHDPLAHETSVQTGLYLGRGVAKLVNVLEPEVVLFAGGLAESLGTLMPWTREAFQRDVFSHRVRDLPLRKAELDTPALWGGVALARHSWPGQHRT